ncbi:pro-glucagon-like [Ascaphus truei]|uniref:pro-glucagon-like n=1 Tax=Ascaphus truei TaxID=8439 RepID=UPI003F5904AF
MKSIYCMVGILFMLLQDSWQNPLRETGVKSRSNAVLEGHGHTTYTNDLVVHLEAHAAKAYADWLSIGSPTEQMIKDGTALATATDIMGAKKAKEFIDLLSDDRIYQAITEGISN